MQGYIEQIQKLITQNETVKHQNRRLKKMSMGIVDDIKVFFEQLFPQLLPFKQQSIEISHTSILGHYRRQILAMRLDMKNELAKILMEYECSIDDEQDQTITYVLTDLIQKFKFNMTQGKNSLKARFNRSIQENNTLRQDIKNLGIQLYNLNLQHKKADLILSQKQAQLQNYTNNLQLLKVQYKALDNSIYNIKSKSQQLQKQNIQLHQENNQLHYRYTCLQRQILNRQKQETSYKSQF